MSRNKGFTLIELMIVIAIIAIIAAMAIPGLLAAQRAANERNASATLKTLTTAEADFRANDRAHASQSLYYVACVFGLYALTPSADGVTVGNGTPGTNIRLIEPSLAAADGGTPESSRR